MSVIPSPVVRVLVLSGLFLAMPLLGLEQRFGGTATNLSPKAQQTSQQTQPPPTQGPPRRGGRSSPSPAFGEWWKDEAIKKEMKLTDLQVRQITRLYDDRSRQMKPHSDEFEKQWQELEKMTRERTVDLATYSIQVTRVEGLRTELQKTRSVMLYGIYRMLTPEQYEKLREIRDRVRQGRGGGGPR